MDDKRACFDQIVQKAGLKPEEAAFVGDDVIDLPAMRAGGLAIAVKNARAEVKKDKDGKVVSWAAEMRAPGNLIAEGYTRKELMEKLKPGTEVTVSGNPSKVGAPVVVFIKLTTADGYCLCENAGGGRDPEKKAAGGGRAGDQEQ